MFIKTTRVKGYEYIKLVESYRENGTTKHRVLYNFGRADVIKNNKSFITAVKKLCEILEIPLRNNETDTPAVFEGCSEATLFNYGYLAYLKLWKTLGIEETLKYQQSERMGYSLPETVFLMAVQHLLEPRSKLSTYLHQNRYFHMTDIPLHHMYRATC